MMERNFLLGEQSGMTYHKGKLIELSMCIGDNIFTLRPEYRKELRKVNHRKQRHERRYGYGKRNLALKDLFGKPITNEFRNLAQAKIVEALRNNQVWISMQTKLGKQTRRHRDFIHEDEMVAMINQAGDIFRSHHHRREELEAAS